MDDGQSPLEDEAAALQSAAPAARKWNLKRGGGRITGERLPGATDERDLGLLMAGVSERAA